jgi:hypothetical protein
VGYQCSLEEFAELVRQEHAENVFAKGTGPYFNPTKNTDGHRCNKSTESVHALILDADGAGGPDEVEAALKAAGVGYVFYESARNSPECPKWRLVMALSEPFTGSPREWNLHYDTARVFFGTLAGFSGPSLRDAAVAFDPAPKAISTPWYLGHRRTADTPVRGVRYSPGLAIDIRQLVADAPCQLPLGPLGGPKAKRKGGGRTTPSVPSVFVPRAMDPSTIITLCENRQEVRQIRFDEVSTKSHCVCPEHGGRRGSAWTDLNHEGFPTIWCSQCCIRWDFAGSDLRPTAPYRFPVMPGVVTHEIRSRYLSDGVAKLLVEEPDLYAPGTLLVVRSPQATGKTHLFDLVAATKIEERPGKAQLAPSHRCALVADLAGRLGFESYDDGHNARRLATTYDSLHKVPLAAGGGYREFSLLVMDEVSQALRHVVGGTLGAYSPRCLEHLRALDAQTELLLAGDADADAETIATLQVLFPARRIVVINNLWRPTTRTAIVYDKRADHLAAFLDDVKAGIPSIYLTSGGPKRAGAVSKRAGAVAPEGAKRLVFSSETSKSALVRGVISDINTKLPEYDVVIGTPTLGSGVDIQDPRRTRVYLDGPVHDVGADELVQLGFRARQSMEWHVFAGKAEKWRPTKPEHVACDLLTIEDTSRNAMYWAFKSAPQVIPVVEREVLPRMAPLHDLNFKLYCRAAAHIHGQTNRTRVSLIARLREAGFTVRVKCPGLPDSPRLKAVREGYREACDEVDRERAEAIVSALDVSLTRAEEIEKARMATDAQSASAEKARLTDFYGQAATVPLVLEDDRRQLRGGIVRLATFLLLQAGEKEAACVGDALRLKSGLTSRATAHVEAAAHVLPELLERFGVPRGTRLEDYNEPLKMPRIDPKRAADRELLRSIKLTLGVSYRQKTCRRQGEVVVLAPVDSMQLLSAVLRKFALRLDSVQVKRGGGKIRVYRIDNILAGHRCALAQASMARAREHFARLEAEGSFQARMAFAPPPRRGGGGTTPNHSSLRKGSGTTPHPKAGGWTWNHRAGSPPSGGR